MACTPDQLTRARTSRIGMAGYCAILSSIRASARSSAEIAKLHGLELSTAVKLMGFMRRLRLVHRVDWFRPSPHSRMVPKWRLGAEGDIHCPHPEAQIKRPQTPWPKLIQVATAIEILQQAPTTTAEFADEIGLSKDAGERMVRMLRDVGLVKVGHWIRPSIGAPYAAWVWRPNGPDAVLKPVDQREANRRHKRDYLARQRQKQLMHAIAGTVGVIRKPEPVAKAA